MIVLDRQNLLDLAIQQYGTAEAAFELALANDISLTDDLVAGQELLFKPVEASNKAIADYYANRQLKPATGLSIEDTAGGIEFMGIEIDFIVS
jgi:hypothetical protein